jgi:hypothetical protein
VYIKGTLSTGRAFSVSLQIPFVILLHRIDNS